MSVSLAARNLSFIFNKCIIFKKSFIINIQSRVKNLQCSDFHMSANSNRWLMIYLIRRIKTSWEVLYVLLLDVTFYGVKKKKNNFDIFQPNF